MLKKNPLFCAFMGICVLAFLGLGALVYLESGTQAKARKQLNRAVMQFSSQTAAEISPTEENLAASDQNVEDLERLLEIIRGDLRRGARLTSTDDGVRVTTGIQQYVTEFQRLADAQVNAAGEAQPVTVPDNFGFGFDDYIDEVEVPDLADEVMLLDKQRQVLRYVMSKLIGASPASIERVAREAFAPGDKNQQPSDSVSRSTRHYRC